MPLVVVVGLSHSQKYAINYKCVLRYCISIFGELFRWFSGREQGVVCGSFYSMGSSPPPHIQDSGCCTVRERESFLKEREGMIYDWLQ